MAITEHFLNGAMLHELLIGAGRGAQTRPRARHLRTPFYCYKLLFLPSAFTDTSHNSRAPATITSILRRDSSHSSDDLFPDLLL